MRLLMITSMMLLASCGPGKVSLVPVEVSIPEKLLQQQSGWTGPAPTTNEEFAEAARAEIAGRRRANQNLASIAKIVGSE